MALLHCFSVAFQSTRPVKGATGTRAVRRGRLNVSIHAPREGRDLVATNTTATRKPVSIHAPREGRDGSATRVADIRARFQSTRPVKGATLGKTRWGSYNGVSIHAPREGRDEAVRAYPKLFVFQSTRPVKGATRGRCNQRASRAGFNPRAP